jgi:hypothetical protein
MLHEFLFRLQTLAAPPLWTITFGRHGARCTRGRVAAGWLADCQDLASHFDLTHGRVDGVRRGRAIALRFSPDVPAASHQRFRNVFGTHLTSRG